MPVTLSPARRRTHAERRRPLQISRIVLSVHRVASERGGRCLPRFAFVLFLFCFLASEGVRVVLFVLEHAWTPRDLGFGAFGMAVANTFVGASGRFA